VHPRANHGRRYDARMDPEQAAIASEFDEYSSRYADEVDGAIGFSPLKADFFVRAKSAHLRQLVAKRIGSDDGHSVLDVGCGVGMYHSSLATWAGPISGIDVSGQAVKEAARRHPTVNYHTYPGDVLPFPDRSFDVVFAACVLHHVPVRQWPGFVSEMYRVTAPGGLTVIFEHNRRNPFTRKAVRDCPFDQDAVLVDVDRSMELLNAVGGKPEVEYILTIPAISGPLKWIDRGLARLRFGTQYCCFSQRDQCDAQ